MSELQTYMAMKYQQEGVLDPKSIHDDWEDPEHPLHDRLEWNDAVAGYEYRLLQIARDIRYIERVWVADDGTNERVRQYLANREIGRPERGYVSIDDALKDPRTLAFMSKSLDLEIQNMSRRFHMIEDYAERLTAEAERQREARRTRPRKTAAKKTAPRKQPPRKR